MTRPEDPEGPPGKRTEPPRAPTPDPAPEGPAAPSPVGTVLNDNYRIDRQIGEGGMGEVYEGEHLFTGNRVAIKMILRELSADEAIVGLFRREARILFDLSDDAIVRYLDSFHHRESDRYCLVMQYIDGEPLADRLEASGPLPLDQVVTLARRLAIGLGKAHSLGVVHRDLSPDNVMLRDGEVARAALIDFGIATAEDKSEATLFGRFAGKYRYVAPEQLGLHGGQVGPRTDIYGLGLLLAAAARGEALDMGRSFPDAVMARERVPALDGIPERLRPLIARMLEPDPAARPASMGEVAALLDDPGRVTAPPAPDRTVIATPPGAAQGQARPAPVSGPPRTTGLGRPVAPVTDTTEGPFRMPTAPPEAAPARAPARRAGPWIGLLALLAALGGGAWLLRDRLPLPAPAAPVEVAAPDPGGAPDPAPAGFVPPPPDAATRAGFLAGAVSGCAYATRVTAGADAGRIAVFADREGAAPGLADAYGEAFGVAPALVRQRVAPAQCPALAVARGLQGRGGTAPALVLDAAEVAQGGTVLGRVSGASGRGVALLLVTSDGETYDLSPRLEPQADGSLLFAFTLAAAGVAEPQPQLLVALASPDPLVAAATLVPGSDMAALADRLLPEASEAGAVAQVARFELTP
ncbi:serine/threonine protein kinase [Jannaschia sp. Os4]|uniref:serine/threonine-protein kinase n=1 Tax=Jannaschia sp. Os4 TaxID=2807617 RepID=UPI00193A6A28|nr:serine/threonine-protein kinase [Jannaschia sp. Os4]MBM2578072.1 serine/threonine protein kinase [Jannaschia sp. Os4]